MPIGIYPHSIPKSLNNDGLDNRRCNLRPCTHAENLRNNALRRDNSTGYRGVSLNDQGKQPRWRAQIAMSGKLIHLGMFGTPEEAARAYDAMALKLHGKFASPNFPYTD